MLRLDNRGQIRILEAFIAVGIVFSALIITVPALRDTGDLSASRVLYSIGMNALTELDKESELGKLITQNSWQTISKQLSLLMPNGISYILAVSSENKTLLNVTPASINDSPNPNSVTCIYAAVGERCQFYIINLQLAWMK